MPRRYVRFTFSVLVAVKRAHWHSDDGQGSEGVRGSPPIDLASTIRGVSASLWLTRSTTTPLIAAKSTRRGQGRSKRIPTSWGWPKRTGSAVIQPASSAFSSRTQTVWCNEATSSVRINAPWWLMLTSLAFVIRRPKRSINWKLARWFAVECRVEALRSVPNVMAGDRFGGVREVSGSTRVTLSTIEQSQSVGLSCLAPSFAPGSPSGIAAARSTTKGERGFDTTDFNLADGATGWSHDGLDAGDRCALWGMSSPTTRSRAARPGIRISPPE